MIRIFSALFAAVVLLASLQGQARAADEPNYMLGTQLIMFSASQLTQPNQGWWADMLPADYSYGLINLVNAANESRKARGISTMIDVKTYPVAVGGEIQVEGGWEYNIDFNRMTPEDVQAVLAAYPLSGKLADTKISYRPMSYGYFYGHGDNGADAVLSWEGQSINVSWGESFDSVQAKVKAMLDRLAPGATFDLSMSQYMPAAGNKSLDVNVSIYLNGATSPNPIMYQEGGM